MYKYEMHSHTKETSRCASIPAAELAEFYKEIGYSGLVITDHFFNGNTTVPRNLPWRERVEMFSAGYENAHKRGTEIGLDVFFGWEFSVSGTDFLTYGLDKQWLLEHEDCDKLRIGDYCDLVHESGGYIVQAHPFREASYIEMIRLLPRKVDAVETINSGRTDFENKMADNYADNYSLIKFCGSDNHTGLNPRLTSLNIDFIAKSANEIMEAVKANKHEIKLYNVSENNGIITIK